MPKLNREQNRVKIWTLREEGLSWNKIAEKTQKSRRSVRKFSKLSRRTTVSKKNQDLVDRKSYLKETAEKLSKFSKNQRSKMWNHSERKQQLITTSEFRPQLFAEHSKDVDSQPE